MKKFQDASIQPLCMKCNYPLYPTSNQYYCCDKNQRYCILCRGKNCISCNKQVDKIFQPQKCKICFSRADYNQLKQPICQSYYCAKCLISRIMMPSNMRDKKYALPCGHDMQIEKVEKFIKENYCSICGRKYDMKIDYQLITGDKCCFQCFRWEKNKIKEVLIICLGCQKVIRTLGEIPSNSQGLILCFQCAKQSCLQEEICQKSKSAQKVKTNEHLTNNYVGANIPQYQNLQKNKSPPKQSIGVKSPQYQINVLKPPKQPTANVSSPVRQAPKADKTPPKNSNKPQQVNVRPNIKITYQDASSNQNSKQYTSKSNDPNGVANEKISPNSNNTQNKLFKGFEDEKHKDFEQVQSVLQFHPSPAIVANPKMNSPPKPPLPNNKQSPRANQVPKIQIPKNKTQKQQLSSNNSLSNSNVTILQQFPQQSQSPRPKLSIKKHLSMDTFVQRMKIQILKDKQKTVIIQCKDCNYELQQKQAFSIENSNHELDQYCRICYMNLTNKQLLGFNLLGTQTRMQNSRKLRGTSNQRHKIPTNYYDKKQSENNNLPSLTSTNPHPTTIYTSPLSTTSNTTYISVNQPILANNNNTMKKSDTFVTAPNSSNFYHQRIPAVIKVSDSRSLNRDQCTNCKQTGQSLIRTTDRGALCFSCYYKKR